MSRKEPPGTTNFYYELLCKDVVAASLVVEGIEDTRGCTLEYQKMDRTGRERQVRLGVMVKIVNTNLGEVLRQALLKTVVVDDTRTRSTEPKPITGVTKNCQSRRPHQLSHQEWLPLCLFQVHWRMASLRGRQNH
jgi:hypothetical protein